MDQNIKAFIAHYCALLLREGAPLHVEDYMEGDVCRLSIYVEAEDMGRLIGKHGKMICALKTLISGCKAKDGISYKIVIKDNATLSKEGVAR